MAYLFSGLIGGPQSESDKAFENLISGINGLFGCFFAAIVGVVLLAAALVVLLTLMVCK